MTSNNIDDYSLWKEFKEKGNEEVFQELILKYLSLVKYQAGRIKMVVPGFIDEEDLVSYGIIGLMDAVNKYDYRKGIKFNTYASIRIRGAIIDHLRELDWLPHSLRRDARRVKETYERINRKTGKTPSFIELEEATGIKLDRIKDIFHKLYSSQWISLYDEVGDTRVFELLPTTSDKRPETIFEDKHRVELLAEAIERLSKTEKMVISLYYYEELTQKEIGKVLDLSPARVSQIHKKAVYRLRGILGKKKEQLVTG